MLRRELPTVPLQPLRDGTRIHIETTGDGAPTLVPCIASSIPYEVSFGEELKNVTAILSMIHEAPARISA